MGTLFEGFQMLCTDYDYILRKMGDSIQGRTLYKGGHYSRKYGMPRLNIVPRFFLLKKKSQFLQENLEA